MGPTRRAKGPRGGGLSSLLTFEHMITGPVIHLVYWCGLGVIMIAAFGVAGASIGIAVRDQNWETWLAAIPTLVGGLLLVLAGGLVWRAVCEFYVVIFRIGEDLAALRRVAEQEQQQPPPRA